MKKKFLFGETWYFEDFLPSEPVASTWGFVVQKEIYSGKSKFQKIEVFGNKEFGRVLVLDGFVQLSSKHEFIYHEMISHPALISHSKPERVLILGGGDGGVLREAVKHPVKEIFLADIDKKVIDASKKYLPSVSNNAFSDKRLKVFAQDALEFVKDYKNYFDIIIYDLTDPTGHSLALWQTGFFQNIKRALRKNGIASFQTGYLSGERFSKKARARLKKVFPFFKVYRAFVGCFPFSEHTFFTGSKETDFGKINFNVVIKRFKQRKLKTKYYCPEIHFSSAVFPPCFTEKA